MEFEQNSTLAFPAAVPEIPVADIDRAMAYYVDALGFTHDWVARGAVGSPEFRGAIAGCS